MNDTSNANWVLILGAFWYHPAHAVISWFIRWIVGITFLWATWPK